MTINPREVLDRLIDDMQRLYWGPFDPCHFVVKHRDSVYPLQMNPEEVKLVALEYAVDTAWQAVLDGYQCGAPEEDQYCGGCVSLMKKFEEAVRTHERALIITRKSND